MTRTWHARLSVPNDETRLANNIHSRIIYDMNAQAAALYTARSDKHPVLRRPRN